MFSKLIESSGFWGVSDVLLSILMNEINRYLCYKYRIYKLKCIVKEELKAILAMIPDKKNIIQQIIKALKKHLILSGLSVNVINIGYKNYIPERKK